MVLGTLLLTLVLVTTGATKLEDHACYQKAAKNPEQYLNLDTNQLTGPIPASIGDLSLLTSLRFYDNDLTGTIPASLGKLTKLQWNTVNRNSCNSKSKPNLSPI